MLGVWLQALAVVLFFLAMVASVVAFGLHRRSTFATEGDAMMSGISPERQAAAPLPRQAASAPVKLFSNFDGAGPLPLTYWWKEAVKCPIHILIVGESNSGKTTTARALLAVRSTTDKILVIDPHAGPDTWSGLPAVGAGRDYAAIDTTFQMLDAELTQRYKAIARGDFNAEPLTIFIDEYPVIAAECKNAPITFKRLVREGRKARMRIVLLTQDANVKTLGIEGEGPVRENLRRILLGSFARVPGVNPARPAASDITSTMGDVAIEVTGLDNMRAPYINFDVMWQRQTEVQKLDAQETVFAASESAFGVSGLTFSSREIAKISAQIARGEKKTDVVTSMPGYASRHHSRFAAMYDELKAAIENN